MTSKEAFHMRAADIRAAIATCTNEGDYAILTGELARRADKRRVKFGRESIAAIERVLAPRPPDHGSDYAIDDVDAWPESTADLYTPPAPWPDEAYTRPGDEPAMVTMMRVAKPAIVASFATLHRAMTAPTADAAVAVVRAATAPLTISERRRARMAAK